MEDKERKEANKKYERARKEELGLPDSSPEEEENAGGAGMATNICLASCIILQLYILKQPLFWPPAKKTQEFKNSRKKLKLKPKKQISGING